MMRRSFPTGLYRRSFSAEYKLRIVTEYDACARSRRQRWA
jgi:hypothetical protein